MLYNSVYIERDRIRYTGLATAAKSFMWPCGYEELDYFNLENNTSEYL